MGQVAIIGGGISGLATAEWLSDQHQVVVLDAGQHPGGHIATDRIDDLVFERGPNGFLDSEPAMQALLHRVGLATATIQANPGPRFVAIQGRMVPVPTTLMAFLTSPLLSGSAKLRLLTEPFRSRGPADESIADFVRRRIGSQPLDRLVGPMVSGIYAGNPQELSISACFGTLKTMEQRYGSLVLAGLAKATLFRAASGPRGTLTTLQGGLDLLPTTLANRLGDNWHPSTPCTALERHPHGYVVHSHNRQFQADAVVLACPAIAQARLVKAIDPALSGLLRAIPYANLAVVATARPTTGWQPPAGFGVLVPKDQRLQILGTLFTSHLFTGHAPPHVHTMRTMIGGSTRPIRGMSDDELIATSERDNTALLGDMPKATHTRVYTYSRAIPQYTLGHPARLRAIRERQEAHPGLFLVGNHLQGIGIKDCAREGRSTANQVKAWFN